jgi:hypothetical protein
MFRAVMEGRKLNEIPDADMLKIVTFIEFIRNQNRGGGQRK